jgi:hypothetical protein
VTTSQTSRRDRHRSLAVAALLAAACFVRSRDRQGAVLSLYYANLDRCWKFIMKSPAAANARFSISFIAAKKPPRQRFRIRVQELPIGAWARLKKVAHTQWAHFVSAPSGLASIRSLPLQRDSAATFPDVSKIAQVHSPAAE